MKDDSRNLMLDKWLELDPLFIRKAAKSAVQRWKTMSAECEPRECHCETSAAAMLRDSNGSGSNENSAVMRHGSYVRIGCFQFVFR